MENVLISILILLLPVAMYVLRAVVEQRKFDLHRRLLILDNFRLGELSEGQAANALGVSRVTLREMMIAEFGEDWRDDKS